jgi:hypothetical protein
MWFVPKPIKYTGDVNFLWHVPISWEPRAGNKGFSMIGQYGADSWKWEELVAEVRNMYKQGSYSKGCFWSRSTKSKDGHYLLTIYTKA